MMTEPTAAAVRPACPECGDEAHIYARADVRWNPELKAWIVGDMEEQLECTECDHEWYMPEGWN